jgi:hypothetical protein
VPVVRAAAAAHDAQRRQHAAQARVWPCRPAPSVRDRPATSGPWLWRRCASGRGAPGGQPQGQAAAPAHEPDKRVRHRRQRPSARQGLTPHRAARRSPDATPPAA